MPSNAVSAQGTLIKRGDRATPTEAFTTIGEIKTFNGPSTSRTIIDVSTLSSTAKEKRAGLKDHGEISFDINFVPDDTVLADLRADLNDSVPRNFQIVFPDTAATTWTFPALVTGFPVSGGVDDVLKGTVTLTLTGDITEA